jgi:hypothetical protein
MYGGTSIKDQYEFGRRAYEKMVDRQCAGYRASATVRNFLDAVAACDSSSTKCIGLFDSYDDGKSFYLCYEGSNLNAADSDGGAVWKVDTTSGFKWPSYEAVLGEGYCSDWKYLPEGAYPARLSSSSCLYDSDPVIECLNRCQADFGTNQKAIFLKSDKCACATGSCTSVVPYDGYTAYRVV